MRVSILIMAFLPPFRALTSASSARVAASLHCASRSFLSFSRFMASSCSQRSSSARRAASTIARAALSSDSLASLVISSRSLFSWPSSPSSFLLEAVMDWCQRAPAQQRDADDQQSRGEHEPQLEVGIHHPVGESAHADPDSLEHTVASQLVHDEWGLHLAGLLVGVGHKATHKVGLAGVEGGHQFNQGNQVDGGDSLAATLLLLLAVILGGSSGLARVVFPKKLQQSAGGGGLHHFHNGVVHGVLVLVQPSCDVVGHDSGVVGDGEVSILVGLGLGLQEDGKLAQGGLQLLLKGLVSGLGEERLLLEDGPDAHGLLKHDDGGSEVHSKVDHLPVNALLHVFLLLHNEHVVVEELLQLLIDKVDGDLLKAVVLKDLKTGNVEHSAEVGLFHRGIDQSLVTFLDQPLEDAIEDSSGNTVNSVRGLLACLTLDDPLSANLDPGLTECLDHLERINQESPCHLARKTV